MPSPPRFDRRKRLWLAAAGGAAAAGVKVTTGRCLEACSLSTLEAFLAVWQNLYTLIPLSFGLANKERGSRADRRAGVGQGSTKTPPALLLLPVALRLYYRPANTLGWRRSPKGSAAAEGLGRPSCNKGRQETEDKLQARVETMESAVAAAGYPDLKK